MKYQGFMPNDFINGEGVCVSLWVSGCPLHCKGCHNKEAWSPDSGYDVPSNLIERLSKAITKNGIERNFSVLGGEPLATYNVEFVHDVINQIREKFPDIKIYVWTGYTLDELKERNDSNINEILDMISVLVTGRYEDDKRTTTQKWIGSTNQKIIYLNN